MKTLKLVLLAAIVVLGGCNKEDEKVIINTINDGIEIEAITGWWSIPFASIPEAQTEIASIGIFEVDKTPGVKIVYFKVNIDMSLVNTEEEIWDSYTAYKEGDVICLKDNTSGTIITINQINEDYSQCNISYRDGELVNTFQKYQ